MEQLTAQETDDISFYQHQLTLDPDNLDCLAILADSLLRQERYIEAKQMLLRIDNILGDNLEIKCCLGVVAVKLKKYEEAKAWYQAALAFAPENGKVHIELADVCISLNQLSEALEYLNKGLACTQEEQEQIMMHRKLAFIYFNVKDFPKSVSEFEWVLEREPDNIEVKLDLVKCWILLWDHDKAQAMLDSIPDYPNIFVAKQLLRARLLARTGQAEPCVALLDQLLNREPQNSDLNYSVSCVYAMLNDQEKTIDYLKKSIDYAEGEPLVLLNQMAELSCDAGDAETGLYYAQKVLESDPKCVNAYHTIAVAKMNAGDYEAVIEWCDKGLAVDINDAELYLMKGIALSAVGDDENDNRKSSVECFLKAMEISPNDTRAMMNMGRLYHIKLSEVGRKFSYNSIKHVIKQYNERVSETDPIYYTQSEVQALANYAYYCKGNALWDDFNAVKPLMEHITNEQITEQFGVASIPPFIANFTIDTEKFLLPLTRSHASHYSNEEKYTTHSYANPDKKKLRIGYISPDLTEAHVIGFLLGDLFSHHDRDRFEVYAYSLRSFDPAHQKEVLKSVDVYRDVTELSFKVAADLIHNDEIDILIDLAGFTEFSRPEILAFQAAPVQAHFLGQTGSMGADFMQYHICTKELVPESQRHYYTEQLVYLPETPIAFRQSEMGPMPSRADYGLPESAFVFCCFNSSYRIDEEVFAAWMQILKQVPDSVLWLGTLSEDFEKNIVKHAKRYNIDPARIIFRPYQIIDHDWHLRLADVYLDTLIISAGTTSILSAWSDVPVITPAGTTPQSSFGAGIQAGIGMPECIVNSTQEYIDLAIELANNPEKLSAMKQKINVQKTTAPLFNQARYVKHLEQAYEQMWADHHQNHPNQQLYVKQIDE